LNSWATVCLWRRYLKYDEQTEERDEIESTIGTHQQYDFESPTDETSVPIEESNEPKIDVVRSDWARRELSDFRRSTSVRDYGNTERHQVVHHPPNPSTATPIATPSTSLDHLDLRVNGMFLPQ
jgi:hypothetical protein